MSSVAVLGQVVPTGLGVVNGLGSLPLGGCILEALGGLPTEEELIIEAAEGAKELVIVATEEAEALGVLVTEGAEGQGFMVTEGAEELGITTGEEPDIIAGESPSRLVLSSSSLKSSSCSSLASPVRLVILSLILTPATQGVSSIW